MIFDIDDDPALHIVMYAYIYKLQVFLHANQLQGSPKDDHFFTKGVVLQLARTIPKTISWDAKYVVSLQHYYLLDRSGFSQDPILH